ncbi:hypothetical protein Emag_000075 [Eimeria magna]
MVREKKRLRMIALLLKLLFIFWAPLCVLEIASASASRSSKSISSQSHLSGQQSSRNIERSLSQRPGVGVSFPLHKKPFSRSSTWGWLDENDASDDAGSPGVFADLGASPPDSEEGVEQKRSTAESAQNSSEDNAQKEAGGVDAGAAEVAVEGATESSSNEELNNNSPPASPFEVIDFDWDLTLPEEENKKPPPASAAPQSTEQLMESLKLDLQEKLVLHHSSKAIYARAQRSGTMANLPQALTGKLCNKVLVRVVKEPSAAATFFSSVMTRLGTAFNRLKAAGKIITSKLLKLFKSDSEGGAESRAVKWIKKTASAAWVKMRAILKSILTVVVRFLPMILFLVNLTILGISISSFAAAPNPISLLGVMSTVGCLVSFIFSTSIQVHTKKTTEQALSEHSEIGDLQLFGLSWASLRAEEDLQRRAIHKNEFGEFEDLVDIDAQQREEIQLASERRAAERRPSGSARRSSKGGSETASTQASSAEEEDGKKATLEKRNSKRRNSKKVTPEELERRTKEARKRMLEKIRVNRVKESFEKAKSKFKQARRSETKPIEKIWSLAKTSVRLLAESLNFGLHIVLERFGKAWEWAVNVGLRKIIRYFRMLTLYIIIAAWFERFVTVLKWLTGQGKFYLKIFDTLRGSASFLILNAEKISALVKGTIQVSASLIDYTVFVALLLNALTKPIYGLYFALQGMKEDATRGMAMKEFESNRKAFTNFLLGSAAVEGDIGKLEGYRLVDGVLVPTRIQFGFPFASLPLRLSLQLMSYLEQYKAHSMEKHELRGMNPLQAYTFYERTVRLDQLLSKMQPTERAKFENIFSSLKNWKIDETATAARDHLLSSVQHCILLASSITNPSNLYMEVRQALRGSSGVLLRHDDVLKLQTLVYDIALDVLARETVLEVPGGGGSVVDTTAVHVNLLPFRTSLSLYDLYHSLQNLFTISMTAEEQKESAISAPLGPIPNTKNCKTIRPSIGLFPESDKAVVQFGEGDCGKIAASNFLRTQIEQPVRRFIREEVFEVTPEECAPFATESMSYVGALLHKRESLWDENVVGDELSLSDVSSVGPPCSVRMVCMRSSAYTAIEIAIEQILLSNIPQSELKDAIKHATDELTDRYQFALEANRALVLSTPSVKVDSVRTLRLLQAVAMLVEESRQFLFRLLARAYTTAIVEHIKNSASVTERVLHNYTYWNEYKLFTKGLRTFDPTSMAIVKLFYYLDDAKLEETLSILFDNTLEGLGEALRNSRESEPSSSPVIRRIHHFVSRKVAYAAEIATAQGNPPPPPVDEREVYAQLLEAYEDVSAEVKELKPLIIKVLKSGQYYPGKVGAREFFTSQGTIKELSRDFCWM